MCGPIDGPGKHVEIDEALVGGNLRHHGKGKHRLNRTTVCGIIGRDGGRMVAGPVPDGTGCLSYLWLGTEKTAKSSAELPPGVRGQSPLEDSGIGDELAKHN